MQVAGRSLLGHALDGLAEAGLKRAVVVLGYGADEIAAHIAANVAWPLAVETVKDQDYRSPNGTSVLAAEPLVGSDEACSRCATILWSRPSIVLSREAGASGGARLGVDRRIENDCVDLEDVTRVQTAGDRIVAIGKGLMPYDCFDTGVFAIGAGPVRGAAQAPIAVADRRDARACG